MAASPSGPVALARSADPSLTGADPRTPSTSRNPGAAPTTGLGSPRPAGPAAANAAWVAPVAAVAGWAALVVGGHLLGARLVARGPARPHRRAAARRQLRPADLGGPGGGRRVRGGGRGVRPRARAAAALALAARCDLARGRRVDRRAGDEHGRRPGRAVGAARPRATSTWPRSRAPALSAASCVASSTRSRRIRPTSADTRPGWSCCCRCWMASASAARAGPRHS